MSRDATKATSFAPLKSEVFLILVALAEKQRHGYSLIQAIRESSDGAVRLRTGPLYRHLKRLLDSGFVEETPERPSAEHDDRRRRCYYRLTDLGDRLVRSESARLARLVSFTRRLGLIETLE